MSDLKTNARELRSNMTSQEKKLWDLIKNRQLSGYRFLRQYVIGNYIADFVCKEKKLVIELDGGQHNEAESVVYDAERTKYIESQGYRVIRFWNNDVDNNIEGVYEVLVEYLSK